MADRGDTYRMIKKYEEAIADLNRSLEMDPNGACSFGRRGEVYRMMKKYEEALVDLNKSLKIDPNDVYIYMFDVVVSLCLLNFYHKLLF